MPFKVLKQELQERFQFDLVREYGRAVHLDVAPNAVPIGSAADANKAAVAEQAYRMD